MRVANDYSWHIVTQGIGIKRMNEALAQIDRLLNSDSDIKHDLATIKVLGLKLADATEAELHVIARQANDCFLHAWASETVELTEFLARLELIIFFNHGGQSVHAA